MFARENPLTCIIIQTVILSFLVLLAMAITGWILDYAENPNLAKEQTNYLVNSLTDELTRKPP